MKNGVKIPNDMFISYAHLDNVEPRKDKEGWVTFFHQTLEAYLNQFLGHESKIWRDPKSDGIDLLNVSVIQQLSNSAVLLAILSPRYVQSDWCLKEISEFLKNLKQIKQIEKLYMAIDKSHFFDHFTECSTCPVLCARKKNIHWLLTVEAEQLKNLFSVSKVKNAHFFEGFY